MSAAELAARGARGRGGGARPLRPRRRRRGAGPGPFPYGTLAVNLLGCFVLGVLVGLTLRGEASELAETGLIGAFTTFSTWMLESHRLGEDRRLPLGALNIGLSLVAGVGLAWLGRWLGGAL